MTDVSNPNLSMKEYTDWKSKTKKMCEFIFDNFINQKDRISINEFCNDIKIICNLLEK